MASWPMSAVAMLKGWTVTPRSTRPVTRRSTMMAVEPCMRHPGDDDGVVGLVVGPIAVGPDDGLRVAVDRAVARGDEPDLEVLDLVEVLLDDLAEGHHDLGVVPLGLRQDAVDAVDEELGLGDVGAEPVAAEEDLVLLEVGRHRLRPVDPGGVDEAEGLAAEVESSRRRRRSGSWPRRGRGGRRASAWPAPTRGPGSRDSWPRTQGMPPEWSCSVWLEMR